MRDTKYAKSGDIHIAYQVVGTGPVDLFFVPGWFTHIELGWEFPPYARFLERLASFSRLILMDKRGTGASDRAVSSLALEFEERGSHELKGVPGTWQLDAVRM